jgi:hypothetical protein
LSTKEAVKQTRRIGELLYVLRIHDPRPGRSLMIAMLLADDQESYVVPLLNRASMLEVRGGFFIEGTEINPRGRALKNIKADTYPQRGFCRPVPRPAPTANVKTTLTDAYIAPARRRSTSCSPATPCRSSQAATSSAARQPQPND